MHFSAAVALAAAIAPIAVSARGRLGYAIGVRHADGTCKSTEDFIEDFNVLQDAALAPKYVRTYAAVDRGANVIGGPPCYVPGAILPAAAKTGIQVVLGLWADDDGAFSGEMTETLKWVKKYSDNIYAFTVGSEGLYRNEQKEGTGYTADYILKQINTFKDTIYSDEYKLKQRVGTADSWNKYQDGTADPLISGGVDLMLVNAFGYWQGQDISNASATYLDDLQQAYGHIQALNQSTTLIELWNGETGWPTTGGTRYINAWPGTNNATIFYKEGVCAALDWNFDVFYFSAFAEPWKPASTGLDGQPGDETHWGAFDVNRKQVITDLSCSYP